MPHALALLLKKTIDREFSELNRLEEPRAEIRPQGESSWSPREELGHLIDSAANNHLRFVRAALEGSYAGPPYAQNEWVTLHGYQEMPLPAIISLWYQYNALLARVIERIPAERLEAPVTIGDGAQATLRFVVEDYILHMRHHIDHLLGRDEITQYPAV